MIFTETKLKGAFILDIEPKRDQRGFFARTYCAQELAAHGLEPTIAQCSLCLNFQKGTLRGMHYQVPPATEVKLVRCTRGAIYDVILDLRSDSPTFLEHIAVELSADNGRMLYVPALFAHGYQCLTDDAEVFYQISEFYAPELGRGLRYDDPALDIQWPLPVSMVAEKDQTWPLFKADLVHS
jgi:dTDP-4-dehydrorhamnose 3,5-epimerase